MLINPGDTSVRSEMLHRLRLDELGKRLSIVAVCGKGDWDACDLSALNRTGAWVFFNELEALEVAGRVRSAESVHTVEEAVRILKAHLERARLVVTLGRNGALLYNGTLKHIATKPVTNGRTVGAGDTMLSVCGVQAALGLHEDEEIVRIAVVAASRRVAGLPIVETKM